MNGCSRQETSETEKESSLGGAKNETGQRDNLDGENKENENYVEVDKEWKEYENTEYGLNFEYPDYLNIIKDEKNLKNPDVLWAVNMETSDYKESDAGEGLPMKQISGFKLVLAVASNIDIENFEQLKEYYRNDWYGGRPKMIDEEVYEENSHQFFVQIFERNDFWDSGWRVNMLYKPEIKVFVQVFGAEGEEDRVKETLRHFLESFSETK